MGDDDERARADRARVIREQIEEMRKGKKRPPRTPRDFVHDKMRDDDPPDDDF